MSFPRQTALVAFSVVAALLGAAVARPPPAARGATPLAIAVVGNHFVDGAGQTVRLLGVDREGTEYACVDGTGYSVGPEDASDAAVIASWHANAVRIPINEDCWLGINGLPAYGTADGYRQMIESYVASLNANGIYAILDLQWTAPGSLPADGLRTMPDEHSLPFWTSVARTFVADPAVVFDAFNEPHSVSWACWRDGGCAVPDAVDGTTPDPSQTYTAVGMQAIIDAIRATGADQPILLSGLAHGNDLSGWLANRPTDPDGQLGASFHVYQPNDCTTTSCWDSTVAPVATVVPVTTAEFSESDCSESFDDTLMGWDDAHGVGYLGWGWFVLSRHCQSLYLIMSWSGIPAFPNGTALHDHLAALAAASGGSGASGNGPPGGGGAPGDGPPGGGGPAGSPPGGGAPAGSPPGGGAPGSGPPGGGAPGGAAPRAMPKLCTRWIRLTRKTLVVRVRSSQRATVEVRARTVERFSVRVARHHARRPIALGSMQLSLPARRWRSIRLRLAPRARRLLAHRRRVWVRVTITATGRGGRSHPARLARTVSATARGR